MDNPFVFGRIASRDSFTNRKSEIKHLLHNFRSGINTILISSRRWDKSSLVFEAVKAVTDRKRKFCFLDLYNNRSENEFYNNSAKFYPESLIIEVGRISKYCKKYIRHIIPAIHIGKNPLNDFSICFDWHDIQKDPTEILFLPEAICN